MVKTAETAPIDPLQLLKALGPLLSPEGGIKSSDEVTRLSSLMKKFSRKLVSRCVYCNVLRTTAPEILTKFLDEHGWDTLNSWFQDARDTDNHSFLSELLKLCKILPMTVGRLKQNNTAKIVRSLSKSDCSEEVKVLATDVVESWMTLIKGERSEQVTADKIKKKKKKEVKPLKEKEKDVYEVKETSKEKIKTKHKERSDYEFKSRPRFEDYEDVKVTIIDEEPLVKRLKIDRPKTVKTFQGKFRSTGLEEETPLPKNVTKKTPTVNKSITVSVVKNAKRFNPVIERFPEKKIKPSSLITPAESSNTGVGIKLIPAKPKPVHVLHESASFMDALVAAPPQPVRRKKKTSTSKSSPTSTTPPSPTLTPPKLQFYKETLDMAVDEKAAEEKAAEENAQDKDKENDSDKEKNKIQTRSSTRLKKEAILKEEAAAKETATVKEAKEDMEVEEHGSSEKDADELKSKENEEDISVKEDDEPSAVKEDKMEETKEENETDVWTAESPPPPGQLHSILSHCKKRGPKKSVKWAEDATLTSVYYFDLDEMERVNVNHIRNFGDLKSLEMKREREAFETARRLMGDKMEEAIPWTTPARILLPPALIEPGCSSKEKDIQRIRQQTTLQDIYFSREMLPDSPYEPDPEPHTLLETKSIPLEDENNMGTLLDYSRLDLPPPKPVLPDVLSNLVMSIANKSPQQIQEQVLPNNMFPQVEPGHNFPPVSGENGMVPNHGLLGTAPQGFLPQMNNVNEMPNEWVPPDDSCGPPRMDPYLVCNPMNQPQMQMPLIQNMRPPGPMMHPGLRMPGPDGMGPPRMGRGQQMPRPQGSRSRGPRRILCKHFWNGTCRYGAKCTFLHPGVNGPPL